MSKVQQQPFPLQYSRYKQNFRLWKVAKRFSEFDTLLQSLANNRFGGLQHPQNVYFEPKMVESHEKSLVLV